MHHALRTIMPVLIACAGSAALTHADDTKADRAAAFERLEAARLAFEAAKAELEAAQREAAEVSGGSIQTEGGSDNAAAQPEGEPADEPAQPEDPISWADGWSWNAVVAANGASGNSENFSARMSLTGERFTSKYETTLGLSYTYGKSEGVQNTSRAVADLRNDWLTEGKWRYFVQGKYEFDEFQAWDHRLSGALGVGYEFYNTEKTTLLGRVGFGGSYEIGGQADETFVPEGLLGLDWRYQWTQNTKLTASTTYYPSFDEIGEFRWNSNAGVEVVMDEESGMTLNAGVEHRHDSQPGAGQRPNDLEYYMGLGWSF